MGHAGDQNAMCIESIGSELLNFFSNQDATKHRELALETRDLRQNTQKTPIELSQIAQVPVQNSIGRSGAACKKSKSKLVSLPLGRTTGSRKIRIDNTQ